MPKGARLVVVEHRHKKGDCPLLKCTLEYDCYEQDERPRHRRQHSSSPTTYSRRDQHSQDEVNPKVLEGDGSRLKPRGAQGNANANRYSDQTPFTSDAPAYIRRENEPDRDDFYIECPRHTIDGERV